MCIIINVFASLSSKLSFNKCVSFESLNGTCAAFNAKAWRTLPSADRDLLICIASFNLSPCACVLLTRSLPAKSKKFNLPLNCFLKALFTPLKCRVSSSCDREEYSFISVTPTDRLALALLNTFNARSNVSTPTILRPITSPFYRSTAPHKSGASKSLTF